jgi:hypothetical protein
VYFAGEAISCATTEEDLGSLHVLYSNMSAALQNLKQFSKAADAAASCVQAKPTWPKGYSHLGLCKFRTGDFSGAIAAYKKVAELDPARKEECERGIALCTAAKPGLSNSAMFAHLCLGLAMIYNAMCVVLGFAAGAAWVDSKTQSFVVAYIMNSVVVLLRTHGRPTLQFQGYWSNVMVDNNATRLLSGMCLILGPNFMLVVALVLPEIASVAATASLLLRGFKPLGADAIVRALEGTLLDKNGAPFWKVAQYSATVEVGAFVFLLVALATPRRNFMQLIVFGQSLYLRIMIEKASQRTSGVMHVAFFGLDARVNSVVAKCPGFVEAAYGKLKGLIARQVQLPDPTAEKAKSKCAVM